MLNWIAIVLGLQLAGELAAELSGLPVPGPVIGMLLLLDLLWFRVLFGAREETYNTGQATQTFGGTNEIWLNNFTRKVTGDTCLPGFWKFSIQFQHQFGPQP